MVFIEGKFSCSQKYDHIWNHSNEKKFIVDNMLFKLVKYLRNIGVDTAYISQKDPNLLIDLSLSEGRIILTKDHNFFKRKKAAPTYLFTNGASNTEDYFKEVVDFF